MAEQKRVLFVVFRPDELPSDDQLRAQFSTSYPVFRDMEALEYKCWWIAREKGQWGAFYVFRSDRELEQYLQSDRWLRVIPEKYGCTPTWEVMDAGMVLSKATITQPEGSWAI
ncbi:MAG: hypothetical protein V1797_13615 [Pseudomonadota bacterium]